MKTIQATDVVRRVSAAYETGDRDLVEATLSDDLYFERCWPNNETIERFTFRRILEQDGEVFVTYEREKSDGSRGRNTEYFVVQDQKIEHCDVYFGPSL